MIDESTFKTKEFWYRPDWEHVKAVNDLHSEASLAIKKIERRKHGITSFRNIALCGQEDSGKTCLVEALVRAAEPIGSMGTLGKHSAVNDYTDEEKKQGPSRFKQCVHDGVQINLINMADPSDIAIVVQPMVETAAVIINAATGVESETRHIMDRVGKMNVRRMIIVNKIDAEHIDLTDLV